MQQSIHVVLIKPDQKIVGKAIVYSKGLNKKKAIIQGMKPEALSSILNIIDEKVSSLIGTER